MITVNFGEFLNDESPIWALCPTFSSLYPEGVEDLTQDMMENISQHYYFREIGFSNPSRFLMEFQRTVKQRAHVWKMLIDSESALTAEDMLFNYDMTETRTRELTIDEETGTESSSTTSGTTTTDQDTSQTRTNNLKQMDTPDGITSDIETYLSYADKSVETTTGTNDVETTTSSTGSGTTSGTRDATHNEEETVTRRGNIGVQTAGQILQLWRQAEAFSAYDQIIFPELDPLFLGTADLDEGYAW